MKIKQTIRIIQPVAEFKIHIFTTYRTILVVLNQDGFLYAPLNALCQTFGLNEKDELVRIEQNPFLMIHVGRRSINSELNELYMRVGFVGIWLLSYPINNVKNEKVQSGLIHFQENTAQFLEEAITEGRLTEWPFLTELLKGNGPMIDAYKEAVAVLGIAREQLLIDAQKKQKDKVSDEGVS